MQLIYAFNGHGKTRLSQELKSLVEGNRDRIEEERKVKILYYNAFTEYLFPWDNDLENNTDIKLQIVPNLFTECLINNYNF